MSTQELFGNRIAELSEGDPSILDSMGLYGTTVPTVNAIDAIDVIASTDVEDVAAGAGFVFNSDGESELLPLTDPMGEQENLDSFVVLVARIRNNSTAYDEVLRLSKDAQRSKLLGRIRDIQDHIQKSQQQIDAARQLLEELDG